MKQIKLYVVHIWDKKDGIKEEFGYLGPSRGSVYEYAVQYGESKYGKKGFDVKVEESELEVRGMVTF